MGEDNFGFCGWRDDNGRWCLKPKGHIKSKSDEGGPDYCEFVSPLAELSSLRSRLAKAEEELAVRDRDVDRLSACVSNGDGVIRALTRERDEALAKLAEAEKRIEAQTRRIEWTINDAFEFKERAEAAEARAAAVEGAAREYREAEIAYATAMIRKRADQSGADEEFARAARRLSPAAQRLDALLSPSAPPAKEETCGTCGGSGKVGCMMCADHECPSCSPSAKAQRGEKC